MLIGAMLVFYMQVGIVARAATKGRAEVLRLLQPRWLMRIRPTSGPDPQTRV